MGNLSSTQFCGPQKLRWRNRNRTTSDWQTKQQSWHRDGMCRRRLQPLAWNKRIITLRRWKGSKASGSASTVWRALLNAKCNEPPGGAALGGRTFEWGDQIFVQHIAVWVELSAGGLPRLRYTARLFKQSYFVSQLSSTWVYPTILFYHKHLECLLIVEYSEKTIQEHCSWVENIVFELRTLFLNWEHSFLKTL